MENVSVWFIIPSRWLEIIQFEEFTNDIDIMIRLTAHILI